MVGAFTQNFEATNQVQRGLAYYVQEGFEVSCPALGAQKQVLGGGKYKEGIGFAIGVDRMMLLAKG
jgi:histidyl-tRNA synthetase